MVAVPGPALPVLADVDVLVVGGGTGGGQSLVGSFVGGGWSGGKEA